MTEDREKLKVSASTRPQILAGAIVKFIVQDRKEIEIVAVGAGAVNQATKALIMARRYISSSGVNLAFIPAFADVVIDGKQVTAIKWIPVHLK